MTAAANSPYAQFKTNQQIESEGITLDYGSFYLRVGRAGGANKTFKRTMKRIFDPHRRAIQTETLAENKLTALMIQAYAEGNVYAWGYTKEVDGKSVTVEGKMLDEEGAEMDFNVANVKKLFTDLPDLFADVQEQCGKVSLFRDVLNDDDAKNS